MAFNPLDLTSLYGFPAGDGTGQTIAITCLDGGYSKSGDLDPYWSYLGIAGPAAPVDVSVDSVTNQGSGSGGESWADLQVAGAVAPGANFVVYFAPTTDAGLYGAIAAAISDTTNNPTIISCSQGRPEQGYYSNVYSTTADAFDALFQDAVAVGITIFVASGDYGAESGNQFFAGPVVLAADFPSSSPHCVSVGGTRLTESGGVITSETVWNDGPNNNDGKTGGGVSNYFAAPAWQSGLSAYLTGVGSSSLSNRGVPDVAAFCSGAIGFILYIYGYGLGATGGTSLSAPFWAGLTAILNQGRGSNLPFLAPLLYANPGALNDITSGDNQGYDATSGWDACTGLGSPNGAALSAALNPCLLLEAGGDLLLEAGGNLQLEVI